MFRKKYFWLVIIILLLLASAGPEVIAMAQVHSPTNKKVHQIQKLTPENLETFLDEYLPEQMEQARVPGLVITVVQGDQVLLAKGYGYANIENEIPMTSRTNIRAGSVSKSILATAVIQLVEQGILELDAPVSEYISDLDLDDEHGGASTIGQLLQHTAGYSDKLLLSHSPDLGSEETLGEVLHADLPARAFGPGLVSAYSDWNFSLLGYAIEGATGKPYETAVSEILFQPMGMESSTYVQPLRDEIYNNLATGYGWDYSKNRYNIVSHDFVRMSPGIALVTNGEDMGNYMRTLLNDGELDGNQIFSDHALGMLLERQGSAHPYSRGWSYAFVENTISGRRVLNKDGNGIGFANRVVLIPEYDLGIFISTNHRNLGEGLWITQAAVLTNRTLVAEILENFIPESEIKIPDVQPLPDRAERADRYTGHYQKAGVARNDFFKLEAILDNVNVKDNGDGTLQIGSGEYQEVEPLVFQNTESPGFFTVFVENQDDEIEFLTFGGQGSYQKVPWYQTKNFQIFLLSAVALISLAMLIIWPFTRQGHWMGWVVSLLNLGFLVGVALVFVPSITDMLIFFKTIPLGVRILFILPWVIGILSIALLYFLVVLWKDGDATWWGRVQYTLLTVASFALVWFANFWNLIWK